MNDEEMRNEYSAVVSKYKDIAAEYKRQDRKRALKKIAKIAGIAAVILALIFVIWIL